jgi:hypothetical protein
MFVDMAQLDRSLYTQKTKDYLYHIVETDTGKILGTFETRFLATQFFNTLDFDTHHFEKEEK